MSMRSQSVPALHVSHHSNLKCQKISSLRMRYVCSEGLLAAVALKRLCMQDEIILKINEFCYVCLVGFWKRILQGLHWGYLGASVTGKVKLFHENRKCRFFLEAGTKLKSSQSQSSFSLCM